MSPSWEPFGYPYPTPYSVTPWSDPGGGTCSLCPWDSASGHHGAKSYGSKTTGLGSSPFAISGPCLGSSAGEQGATPDLTVLTGSPGLRSTPAFVLCAAGEETSLDWGPLWEEQHGRATADAGHLWEGHWPAGLQVAWDIPCHPSLSSAPPQPQPHFTPSHQILSVFMILKTTQPLAWIFLKEKCAVSG